MHSAVGGSEVGGNAVYETSHTTSDAVHHNYLALERGQGAFKAPDVSDYRDLFKKSFVLEYEADSPAFRMKINTMVGASFLTLMFTLPPYSWRFGVVGRTRRWRTFDRTSSSWSTAAASIATSARNSSLPGKGLPRCSHNWQIPFGQSAWDPSCLSFCRALDALSKWYAFVLCCALKWLNSLLWGGLVQIESYRDAVVASLETTFLAPMQEFVKLEAKSVTKLKHVSAITHVFYIVAVTLLTALFVCL
jgi:hypothetical protein